MSDPSRGGYGPALSDTDFNAFVRELLAKKYPPIYGWTVNENHKLPDGSTVDFYVARKDPHGGLIESLVVNARAETVTLADIDRTTACRAMQKAGRSMIFVPKTVEVSANVRDYAMKSRVHILPFTWHPSASPKTHQGSRSQQFQAANLPAQMPKPAPSETHSADEQNTRRLDETTGKLKATDDKVQDMCNVVYGISVIPPPPQILSLITDALIAQINSVLGFVRIAREFLLPAWKNSPGSQKHYEQMAEILDDIEARAVKQLDTITNSSVDPNNQFVAIGEAHSLTVDSLTALSQLTETGKNAAESVN